MDVTIMHLRNEVEIAQCQCFGDILNFLYVPQDHVDLMHKSRLTCITPATKDNDSYAHYGATNIKTH